MNGIFPKDVAAVWEDLLLDFMFAKNYDLATFGLGARRLKNAIVDKLMPSLLHIKAVAIVDHALIGYYQDRGMSIPAKYRDNLHGRIEFLADSGLLSDRARLHQIRDTRNDMAHEPAAATNWTDLAVDCRIMNEALRELSLVGQFPNWDAFAAQSAAKNSTDPGVAWEQDFRLVIHETGDKQKEVAVMAWKSKTMRRAVADDQ